MESEEPNKIAQTFYDEGILPPADYREEKFGIRFIASEWNFNMYQLTESLDFTSVIMGY